MFRHNRSFAVVNVFTFLMWLIRSYYNLLVNELPRILYNHIDFSHLHTQIEKIDLVQKLCVSFFLPQKLKHRCPPN